MELYTEVAHDNIFPNPPKRIVSLCPSITEMLVKLGKANNIVGVSAYCIKFLKGLRKPVVGSYIDVKYEILERLEPDIVLTMGPAQLQLSKKLHKMGFRVFQLRLPVTPYGIIENIVSIGLLVGEYDKAHAIAEELLKILKEASECRPSERANVYVEVGLGEPYSVGALTFTDGLIRLAGGLNIFHNRLASFFKPNFSDVTTANPDILIFEFENGRRKEIHELIAERKWNDLAAVKCNRILKLRWPNCSIAHPGPSAINAISVLSAKIREVFSTST